MLVAIFLLAVNIEGKIFMLVTLLTFQFKRFKEFLDQKAKLLYSDHIRVLEPVLPCSPAVDVMV